MLRDEWQFGGFPIAEKGARREAFNLVLSMPAGTNEVAVLRAARDFAANEFGAPNSHQRNKRKIVHLVDSGQKTAADSARLFNFHPTVARLLARSRLTK
jgi:hypothetical protein